MGSRRCSLKSPTIGRSSSAPAAWSTPGSSSAGELAIGWWLPTLYAWGSIDATDVAMVTLTLMATIIASTVSAARLVIAVVAVAVVLVCVLMIAWAAMDLVEASG